MPRFDYECERCGDTLRDVLIGMTADSKEPAACTCGGCYMRLIGAPARPSCYSMGYGEDPSSMGPGEIHMHRKQAAVIDKAARDGTLIDVRAGERTPEAFRPAATKKVKTD